jgi:hypothetical protein
MTKFPKSGAPNKWEGLADLAMIAYKAFNGDYNDHKDRAEFTQRIVKEMWDNCDQDEIAGFLITCTDYTCHDYVAKTELVCRQLPFDVLCFSGERESYYHHKGDGGYINWAMIGYFTKDGGDVYFHETPGSKRKKEEERKKEEDRQKREEGQEEKRREEDKEWHHGHTGPF